uniref:Uncharacterized protein n=1 Tax=Lactuca sativa TaxID=4236 RepID=A0A9R1WUN5_LACSA|nr:hypothetical protein LSAT_V11C900462800 [Lactuca sativa]
MIQAKGGVDALSTNELCEDCRERGMLGLRSMDEIAFTMSRTLKPNEVESATLSSLQDEVLDIVGVTLLPYDNSVLERMRKLDFFLKCKRNSSWFSSLILSSRNEFDLTISFRSDVNYKGGLMI